MKTHAYLLDIKEICKNNHLTVDQIFEKLKKSNPKVGRSTVYRNVEEMTKLWVLTKIIWIQDKALYELVGDNHIHLIDTESGYIKDLDIDNINIPWIPYNFTVDYMNVDIYGKFK